MNPETDSALSWEALCRQIVSPVLIIHVKIIHYAALLSAFLPAAWLPPPLRISISQCQQARCIDVFVLCQPWETVAPSNQELFWLEVAQRSEIHSFPFRKDLVTILISPSVRTAQHSEAYCGQADSPGGVHQAVPHCRKGRKRRGRTPMETNMPP